MKEKKPAIPTGADHATLAVLTCICDALIEAGQIKREDLARRVHLVSMAMDRGSIGERLVATLLLSLRDQGAADRRKALMDDLTPPDATGQH
jgi:hypothetical protein